MLIFYLSTVNESAEQQDSEQLEAWISDLSGGPSSLEHIYRATSTSVYSFALSILKSRQDAEDVLHDCYVNLFAAAQSYRPQGKPLAWILSITKNLCLMKLRSQKRAVVMPSEDWSSIFAGSDLPEHSDDRLMLVDCLSALSDEERQIVILHSISGFKHREIAGILAIPLSTVISKYNRSIKKMSEILSKGEETHG